MAQYASKGWVISPVSPPPAMAWQCGEHVVLYLELDGPLPPLCLWTGIAVGSDSKSVEICAQLPNAWRWRFPPLRFGYERAFHTLVLQLPVSAGWLAELKASKARRGRLVLIIAAICSLVLLGVTALTYPADDAKVVIFPLTFILASSSFVISVVIVILGAMWTQIRGMPGPGAVPAKLTEYKYLWLAGVHPLVRAQLPEWRGKQLDGYDFRFSWAIVAGNLLLNVAAGFWIGVAIAMLRSAWLRLSP